MNADVEKAKNVVDFLCEEIHRGILFYQIVKTLRVEFENGAVISARSFFTGVYEACERESILSLTKLTHKNEKSITMDTLLNIATVTPKVFKYATSDMVVELIKQHQELKAELQSLISNATTQRDWTIAHLDKKHINQPDIINSHGINMTALGNGFDELAKLINTYRIYLKNGEYSFKRTKEEIQHDVAYLMDIMNKDA
jgi:hypothetical protein